MPRLPDHVLTRLQPASTRGPRLASTEVNALSPVEARAVATQAVDAVENQQALVALRSRLSGEAPPSPLSSLAELPAGQRWLSGALKLSSSSSPAEVKVLQRALMKVGAHHAEGRAHPELMLLPWGADGSLGAGTLKALDVALRLAGRADLVPASAHLPLGIDVARALDGLLRATPSVTLPPQNDVFPTSIPRRLDAFGFKALPLTSTPYDAKWKNALARIDAELPRYHSGASGLSPAAATWVHGLEALRAKPDREVLEGVNRLVNATTWKADAADTWQSPLDFFANRGDCEDFVIAKYASLVKLGFDESRLRLLIVTDTVTRQAHAVLAVDCADATYILDNQNQRLEREPDLRYADGSPHYQAMFALARHGQWLFGRPT